METVKEYEYKNLIDEISLWVTDEIREWILTRLQDIENK